jgi:hypothetical protein
LAYLGGRSRFVVRADIDIDVAVAGAAGRRWFEDGFGAAMLRAARPYTAFGGAI